MRRYKKVKMKDDYMAIMSCLKDNPRITMTKMSKLLNIPVSTLFDYINDIEKKLTLKGYWE